MILFIITNILMIGAIIAAFLIAPKADILGDAARTIYFHVPLAWLSVLAFITAAYYSVVLLKKRDPELSIILHKKSHNAVIIGLLCTILTTTTGAMWAKISWGAYWNWDPRQTSIIILLAIYIAYICLKSVLEENPDQGKICAAYLIIAAATVPFLIFVVPRIFPSLHPQTIITSEQKIHMEMTMRLTLVISAIAHTCLYAFIFKLMNRISRMEIRIEEKHYEV